MTIVSTNNVVDKNSLFVAYLDKYYGRTFGFVCFFWIVYACAFVAITALTSYIVASSFDEFKKRI